MLLKGYLALSNVRLRSGKSGGVMEADILGLKLIKEARDVKGGSGGGTRNCPCRNRKLAPECARTIREISLDAIELESVLGRLLVGLF
ncbi:MAG: hypothetical protein DRJ44_02335 [Thermoprotei archaeon]|nr:MAG: hypothetical protein DRJ44_02335 [Thermoprotei archaeon]